MLFNEQLTLLRILFLAMILIGIIGLKIVEVCLRLFCPIFWSDEALPQCKQAHYHAGFRLFVAYPLLEGILHGPSGVIKFKGNPMTLLGNELKVGSPAPDFTVHYFEGGLKTITKKDLLGKPRFCLWYLQWIPVSARFRPNASIKI